MALVGVLALLAPALPLQAAPGAAERTLRGTFQVISGDPRPGRGGTHRTQFGVIDADGAFTRLELDAGWRARLGDGSGLARREVVVSGTPLGAGRLRVGELALAAAAGDGEPQQFPTVPRIGSPKWANLLCRFADTPDVTPREPAWFATLFGHAEPQIGHYFRDTSYGALDLAPVDTYGWYTLPYPRAHYLETLQYDDGDQVYFKQWLATEDCARLADADVNFPDYDGLNLAFNDELDGYAYGGGWWLNLDGVERAYGMTWLPVWGYNTQYIMAHEIGHAMGLPHSSGPYGFTYDSMWDLMSGGGACNPPDDDWGCVGVHTIAWHKELLGWLPDERLAVVNDPGVHAVTLNPLSEPGDGDALLLKVPIQGSPSRFYTVEFRRMTGYDRRIPREALVIHRVDTNQYGTVAVVVDPDGNGDPNDDASQWVAGETFSDPLGELSIRVESVTGNRARVIVTLDTAFRRVWARADDPVAGLRVDRTWMWGPEPFLGPLEEEYYDAPHGKRTVVYFDKSRMEITRPDDDPTSVWYVTNGLLVVELISGRLQLSDIDFEQRLPAEINVAGDAGDPDGPTYASFTNLRAFFAPEAETAVVRVVRRDGTVHDDARFAAYAVATTDFIAPTSHRIALPFWAFMNAEGLVNEHGADSVAPLFLDPYYATGYPIIEPYWTTVRVGGVPRDVLIQCFERRCLTWTPSNPPGWQVEAGNVGRHYHAWRYAEQGFAGRASGSGR